MKKDNLIENDFKGYLDYTDEEMRHFFNEGLIVPDTNVLLNLYECSKEARVEIMNIFTKLKDRTWVPYHVAEEFFKNRFKVMDAAEANRDEKFNDYNKSLEECMHTIEDFKSSLCDDEIKEFEKIKNKLTNEVKEKRNKNELKYRNDSISNFIKEIFFDACDEKFTEEEKNELKKDYDKNIENFKSQKNNDYDDNIFPGFCDHNKTNGNKYGDYLIYHYLIKKAEKSKRDIVFITADEKVDWFEKHRGFKFARQSYLNHFYIKTGQKLLIISYDDFINHYTNNKNTAQNTIQEIKNMEYSISNIDDNLQSFDFYNNFIKYRNILAHTISEIPLLKNYVRNNNLKDKQKFNLLMCNLIDSLILIKFNMKEYKISSYEIDYFYYELLMLYSKKNTTEINKKVMALLSQLTDLLEKYL